MKLQHTELLLVLPVPATCIEAAAAVENWENSFASVKRKQEN